MRKLTFFIVAISVIFSLATTDFAVSKPKAVSGSKIKKDAPKRKPPPTMMLLDSDLKKDQAAKVAAEKKAKKALADKKAVQKALAKKTEELKKTKALDLKKANALKKKDKLKALRDKHKALRAKRKAEEQAAKKDRKLKIVNDNAVKKKKKKVIHLGQNAFMSKCLKPNIIAPTKLRKRTQPNCAHKSTCGNSTFAAQYEYGAACP
ncbi:MAG: hypothetical protein HOI80_05225 [Alphaproteobacteria bacterium]|nr:hypothetical protein [Alphaproteobacteria bacterium]MBT5390522.1 hypothetical protein [Alphaproteobacteria bacterium]MBT5540356.1 hypothetical protein [Alphaproteobacteria bacterium]MBT5654879.1 hypothetical protein [Alphaproteobacteria bacterium]